MTNLLGRTHGCVLTGITPYGYEEEGMSAAEQFLKQLDAAVMAFDYFRCHLELVRAIGRRDSGSAYYFASKLAREARNLAKDWGIELEDEDG